MSGRRARAERTAAASRVQPSKRGERRCPGPIACHDDPALAACAPCPHCGAMK